MPDETLPPESTSPQNPPAAEPADAASEASAEAAPAEQAAADQPGYGFAVEDIATLKKKIVVTVPADRIAAKRNEMFGELAGSAAVPGFRVGHAPRRLIERRFGKDIANDVRNALIAEALGQFDEKAKIQTIGEPVFDLEAVVLPDSGDMTFSMEVEVAPEFELPALEGIAVKRPLVQITPQRVEQAIDEIRHRQATHEETPEPAAEGDIVQASARISGEGLEPVDRAGLALRVAPGQIEGLPLLELGTSLTGKKVGETVSLKVKAPPAHPNEAWRDKDLVVEITIGTVRRTVLPDVDEDFAKSIGFNSLVEMREEIKKHLESRVDLEARQLMRDQVADYLLKNAGFDLPEGMVNRGTARVLRRRYIDLLMRGIPQEKIDERLTELQAAAAEEAKRELKLSFILSKIAENEGIEVSDGEVNARVASMARESQRRPERLRQELESEGTLSSVTDSILEEKAMDRLLGRAAIEEVADAKEKPADEPEKTAE